MKKLKKVLALVLAVALAFSLVTVASAATVKDYSDTASIKQTEAVDLFTQLGFLAGNAGAFNPTGTLTREAAAKIIAYMLLGTSKADSLKTVMTSFSDVAPTRWSAGYIQYCASQGIINGDGTGKFNPEADVTGTQFAKMLLTAVGYGKAGEYTGANWEMSVIGDATRLGILSLDVDVTAPATREQAAQYGFNTYAFVYQVVYNATTKSYQNAFDTTAGAPLTTTVNEIAGTLAYEQNVFPATKVLNGVTYRFWRNAWGAVLSGDYATDNIIFTSTNGTSLINLTTSNLTTFKGTVSSGNGVASGAVGVDSTEYYLNGVGGTGVANFAAANAAADKRGAIVQFINLDGDAAAEKVIVTEKTYVKLTAAPVVNDAAGTTTILGICANYKSTSIVGADGLVAGDRVLWYTDEYGTIRINKATAITGQATEWAFNAALNTNTLNFGGTKYPHSELTPVAAVLPVNTFIAVNGANAFNADATIWVDDGNNIVDIGLNATPAAPTYGIVLAYQYNGSLANSARVQIYKQDGTMGFYDVAPNNLGVVPNQGGLYNATLPNVPGTGEFDFAGLGVTGILAQYTVNAAGKITLWNLNPVTGAPMVTTDNMEAYTARSPYIDLDLGVANELALTTSSVVFYFDTAAAYQPNPALGGYNPISVTTTGYTSSVSIPDTNDDTTISYILNFGSTSHVAAGLITSPTEKAYIPLGSNYAYLSSAIAIESNIGGVLYYDYQVIVDGTAKLLRSANPNLFQTGGTRAKGVYYYELDAAGNVITTANATANLTPYSAYGTELVTNMFSYFTLDADGNDSTPVQTLTIGSNCHFYRIVRTAGSDSLVEVNVFSVPNDVEVDYIVTDAATGAATAVYFDDTINIFNAPVIAPTAVAVKGLTTTVTQGPISVSNFVTYNVGIIGTATAAATITLSNGTFTNTAALLATGATINAAGNVITIPINTAFGVAPGTAVTIALQVVGDGAPATTLTIS